MRQCTIVRTATTHSWRVPLWHNMLLDKTKVWISVPDVLSCNAHHIFYISFLQRDLIKVRISDRLVVSDFFRKTAPHLVHLTSAVQISLQKCWYSMPSMNTIGYKTQFLPVLLSRTWDSRTRTRTRTWCSRTRTRTRSQASRTRTRTRTWQALIHTHFLLAQSKKSCH